MKTVVIFSGAGLSKESGIPTFRDSLDGLWHNHKVEDVATPDGWRNDKQLVLDFYKHRWENIMACEPNEGHKAIAKLQNKYNVINITQNIDDLLERAGCKNVWHLHGSILGRKCEWHIDSCMLDGDLRYKCNYKINHDKPVEITDLCPVCNGNMRPDVVWFEEPVNMKYEYIDSLTKTTDIFIGVGTSAQVNPAATLLYQFKNSQHKYFIDPNPPLRLQSYTRLSGTAGEMLPELVETLMREPE